MITIRPAVPDDAALITDIRNTGWREAYSHLLSAEFLAGLSSDAEGLRRGISRGHLTIVVAELDGDAVGYALAGPPDEEHAPRDWCLRHIYQYSRVHGSGTGQALLDAAVGDRRAYLWTAEDNPRAIAFYRRNGFLPDGTRKVAPDWENLAEIRMVRSSPAAGDRRAFGELREGSDRFGESIGVGVPALDSPKRSDPDRGRDQRRRDVRSSSCSTSSTPSGT
jgi:GNAT superfamily N-acetyltransferase